MAKSIEEGFNIFESWLTPTGTETEKAKNHRASIEQCLRAKYTLNRFFRTGSFGNGTSISGYSDTDYFAVLPAHEHYNDSSFNLNVKRKVLGDRFTTTQVVVDSPAIRLEFGNTDWEKIEVTPAFHSANHKGYPVYNIANGKGGWMSSSPEIHNDYVRDVDSKLSGKLKPLIRFVKAWKFYNNVPISSFYLELWVTKFCSSEPVIVYDIDLMNIFSGLSITNLAAITDPTGISGSIDACKNVSDHFVSLTRIKSAENQSHQARTAEVGKNTRSAFEWWNKLYASKFPAY